MFLVVVMKMNKPESSDVVITGGSGYIGSSLARSFSERGVKVSTLDMRPQSNCLKDMNVPHAVCDLRDYDDLMRNLPDSRLAIHTAIVQIPHISENTRLGYEANIVGTQNVCRAVEATDMEGMILTSSWHVFGESGLNGVVSEGFGYRPDKVEDRARLYALCKNGQEVITRLFNEFSDKAYGIVRMGTVLGERMPEKTAANMFIKQSLEGKDLTPYKHSMYRPMVYVSIRDILEGLFRYAMKILNGEFPQSPNSLESIVNLIYPEPMTILELAETVRDLAREITGGRLSPKIEVVDQGIPSLFEKDDKSRVQFDITRARVLLGMDRLISPEEEIEGIIRKRAKDTLSD